MKADPVLIMGYRSALWSKALDNLRPKDKLVIASQTKINPEDLVNIVNQYSVQSKGRSIELNNEKLFVRDLLEKVATWVNKFVQVGDTIVQYDPGHAALPWAALRLVLQVSAPTQSDLSEPLNAI
jgi:hypothetical protein